MAMNLTNQVRSIAEVTKAVAGGDLTKKIDVDVRGEILELKETVNGMRDFWKGLTDNVNVMAANVSQTLLSGIALAELTICMVLVDDTSAYYRVSDCKS